MSSSAYQYRRGTDPAASFRASYCARVRTPGGRWMPAAHLASLAEQMAAPDWHAKRETSGNTRRVTLGQIVREVRATRQRCTLRLANTRGEVAKACAALLALTQRRAALLAELRVAAEEYAK